MLIRPALGEDGSAIWDIMRPVIAAGETYALDPTMGQTEALAYWYSAGRQTFVVQDGDRVIGTYFLRPNQAGGGAHVANCGYLVHAAATGRGVARMMGVHSLDQARRSGFRAMQFNFVVSTNTRAIGLWKSLGFAVVGTLPGAFDHPSEGYVDVFVMFRKLA